MPIAPTAAAVSIGRIPPPGTQAVPWLGDGSGDDASLVVADADALDALVLTSVASTSIVRGRRGERGRGPAGSDGLDLSAMDWASGQCGFSVMDQPASG
jgi:hypothetical protein